MTGNEVPANVNNAAEIQVESDNLQSKMQQDYVNEYDHPFEYQCRNGNFCFKLVVTKILLKGQMRIYDKDLR